MNNHITVIDVKYGTTAQGFAIRIGPEISPNLRLANCYNASTDTIIRISSGNYVKGDQYTPYYDLNEAIKVAKSLKTVRSNYTVRVDCTID